MTKYLPRVSYSGYYATLPRSRCGSDSRYPLKNQKDRSVWAVFLVAWNEHESRTRERGRGNGSFPCRKALETESFQIAATRFFQHEGALNRDGSHSRYPLHQNKKGPRSSRDETRALRRENAVYGCDVFADSRAVRKAVMSSGLYAVSYPKCSAMLTAMSSVSSATFSCSNFSCVQL